MLDVGLRVTSAVSKDGTGHSSKSGSYSILNHYTVLTL